MFRHSSLYTVLITVFLLLLPVNQVFAQDKSSQSEIIVHLLSYVAKDYSEAVADGKVIDEEEYEEQQEFSAEALQLIQEASFLKENVKSELTSDLKLLVEKVNTKSPAQEIQNLAQSINAKIIALTGIETSPKTWPSLSNGQILYAKNCATCHGTKGGGDGPTGIGLEPSPSNFLDGELMDKSSPYQAYNSLQFGVPGTGMRAFTELSESDLWDLAFYVKSLRYLNSNLDSSILKKHFSESFSKIGLEKVSLLNDKELLDTLKQIYPSDADSKMSALRVLEPETHQVANSLPIAKDELLKALESYSKGEKRQAHTFAVSAYLEGIEPVEALLRSIDTDFVTQLEAQMYKVRQTIEEDQGVESLEIEITKAISLIEQAEDLMDSHSMNYWLSFLLAFSIVLREALEAFLILAVVLALIRSANAKKALKWVHGGWITAVLFGIAGWFLSDLIIQFGGKNREILEGLVSLLAVVILVFAGFWLHKKSYAKKWTEFVENKIGVYLDGDKMFGLAVFSFMIVFREAFEVILFLQAILLEAGPQNKSAIGFGTLAAFGAIAVFAYIFMKFTKNLPIRLIFKYSAYLIVFLAVVLIGKGVHSLQESGWISASPLIHFPRITWLGIYATLQTIFAQIGLIVLLIVTYFINKRKMQES